MTIKDVSTQVPVETSSPSCRGRNASKVTKPTTYHPRSSILFLDLETFISIHWEMDKDRGYEIQLYMLFFTLSHEWKVHNFPSQWEKDQELLLLALPLFPPWHPLFLSAYHSLGMVVISRQTHLGESAKSADLNEAITILRRVIPVFLDLPSELDAFLVLAKCLTIRFTRLKDPNDLNEAIKQYETALQVSTLSDSDQRGMIHFELATLFESCYEGAPGLRPIMYHLRRCHRLLSTSHPKRVEVAVRLSTYLHMHLWQSGDETVIDEALQHHMEVISSYSPGHPSRLKLLLKYSGYLYIYYRRQQKLCHLDLACDYISEALSLASLKDDERADALTDLVSLRIARFEETGRIEDLEHGVKSAKEALEICSPSSSLRSMCLNTMSGILLSRHSRFGNLQDLQDALNSSRESVELLSPENLDPLPFVNLSKSLQLWFKNHPGGDFDDIGESIRYAREGVLLARPNSHPSLPLALSALADGLREHYQQMGDVTSLDEAIQHSREAKELLKNDGKRQVHQLTGLSGSLVLRYKVLGDIRDLVESSDCLSQALQFIDPTHHLYPKTIDCLANQIHAAISGLPKRNIHYLDSVLVLLRKALELCPTSNPSRQLHLSNLSWVLLTRFQWRRELKDLEDAIRHLREAVKLPNSSTSSYILGSALFELAGEQKSLSTLQEAIDTLHQVEGDVPEYHSLRGYVTHVLAQAYEDRGDTLQSAEDINIAFYYLEKSANLSSAGLKNCLPVSIYWAIKARKLGHKSSMRAYSTALSLLERYVMISHSMERQHETLAQAYQSLPSHAASCAITEVQLEIAVEQLEQGRAILWSQVSRYRTSLDRLDEVNPTLTKEFRKLSLQLERNVVGPTSVSSREATTYRLHSSQWNTIMEEIRGYEGFSNFLKPTPFETLSKAAINGPVVIINIDSYRSDAIIIQHASTPTLVQLYEATPDDISSLAMNLTAALQLDGDDASKTRHAKVTRVLRRLWDVMVGPIVEALKDRCGISEGSRIWWCPTSLLWALPLHAAGPYRAGEKNLPDIFVSSYTPTLSALLQSNRRQTSNSTQAPPKLLLVGQVDTPRQTRLANVAEEIRLVREFSPLSEILEGEDATCDAVISGLQQSSWVHFACHGNQDLVRPFNSHFVLHDKPLRLLDVIKTDLPNAEFAFLSACHSAAGDRRTPNESIHLASGLQLSGFDSVVGTMWGMADADGPVVAREFYRYMFRNPEATDYRDAAVALNRATKLLRQMKVPIERWINFIHIGT